MIFHFPPLNSKLPKQIADFMSEVLVTGFEDENGNVVLATSNLRVENGKSIVLNF